MINKQNNENFKLIFGIIYASIIVLMILFFNFDNIDKYLYDNKETNIDTYDNTKYINSDDNDNNKQNNNDINNIENVNDEGEIKEEKTISLDRALELLYNNEKNDNVEIYEKDIHTHIRIIKNVSFSGEYNNMDFDNIYINNVITKNKTYNNVSIRIRQRYESIHNDSYSDVNIDNLRIGDRVDVLCSIANGLDFVDDSVKESVRDKYDDFKTYEIFDIKTNRDDKDELLDKYSDKEKIYDLDEFYDDLAIVSNENLKRSDKIFYGIKFKVKAKCVKKFNVYDHYYIEYEIKNDNKIINDDNLKINSQYNYIGEDDNGEDKYYLTKSHFSLPIEKFLDDKDEYKYKDYKKEQAIILENKEIKKGYQDFLFEYTTTYTSDINLVILKEEVFNTELATSSDMTSPSTINSGELAEKDRRGELASPSKELSSDETLNTIKKIGIDTDIDIADRVLFGKNLYWDVVDIDYKDKNKILIMLTNDSVEENIPKMRWTTKESASYKDSDVRKYLNEDFLNEYFVSQDINRMYTTTLDIVIENYNGNTIYDKVNDTIFILSDDDIDEYKWTLTDPIDTSFVRNQRYGVKGASMYRRNKKRDDEYKQYTYNMSDKWSVYPLVWININ